MLATTIDWCEPNYEVTPYIAEFWNTVTSVLCIIPPLWWWTFHHPPGSGIVPLMHPLIAFIFAGSAAFHGTMSWLGQLLDEVPIMLFASFSFSVLVDNASIISARSNRFGSSSVHRAAWGPGPRLLAILCAAEVVVLTWAYTMWYKVYATFIVVVFVQGVLHWPVLIYSLKYRFDWDPLMVRLLCAHVALGYTAGGLWLLEQRFCAQVQFLNLHAVWHVLAMLSMKPYIDMLTYARLRALGHKATYVLAYAGFGPCLMAEHLATE
jgi:dihydroceramidase